MKSSVNNVTKYFLYLIFAFAAISFTSCSNDDDGIDTTEPNPTGSITASDQTLAGNTLIIDNVTVGQDSWLVVRNEGEGNSANFAAEPMFLEKGTYEDLEIELNNTANLTGDVEGDNFDITLYADSQVSGTQGTFDFNTQNSIDRQVNNTNGQPMVQTVNTRAPSISADDQTVQNNSVVFNSVNTARGGFIGIYNQNEDGTINENDLIGWQYVGPGTTENVTVNFREDFVYTPGQMIFPRLFNDDPADQQFTFMDDPTTDVPERFGFNTTTGEGNFVGNNNTAGGGFTIN